MGGYADYALATKVPALWARMQKDQAQKRTGDLAKNMFAQLDGLDPQSKEYFQRMRQLSMESGDDTLYQTGEGLNKSQQGYAFDNPLYTADVKEYILTSGDSQLQNVAALDAFIQRSNQNKATRVNINNQSIAAQPADAFIPYDLQKDVRDKNGNMPTKALRYGDLDGVNFFLQDKLPSEDQQTAANAATVLNTAQALESDYPFPEGAGDPTTVVGARTLVGNALGGYMPSVGQMIVPPEVKAAQNIQFSKMPWLMKAISGADVPPEQKQDLMNLYMESPYDPDQLKQIKKMRIKQQADLFTLRAKGRLPDTQIRALAPGVFIVGAVRSRDGSDINIISSKKGMGYIDPRTNSIVEISDAEWPRFISKFQTKEK